jgi:thiamine-monophosphate kinase
LSSMDEFALIRRLTSDRQAPSLLDSAGVMTGIGDDAAVAKTTPGKELVLTCDTMTEDVHFLPITMRDSDIGYKAMASAISDIAAMGGTARLAMVSVSIPPRWTLDRMEQVYEGLYACANRWNVAVVGGDTTSSTGGLTLSVSVIGEVDSGRALLRSGAKRGDVVVVTGPLGLSAAGLDYLLKQRLRSDEWPAFDGRILPLVTAHCRPDPRLEAGELLLRSGRCHALNDVSDGLASEAWELAEASGVGIDLLEERIRVTDELYSYTAGAGKDALDYILYGGEDYQLIGTVEAAYAPELQVAFREAGLTLDVVGYVTAEDTGVRLIREDGTVQSLDKKGYNHFTKG